MRVRFNVRTSPCAHARVNNGPPGNAPICFRGCSSRPVNFYPIVRWSPNTRSAPDNTRLCFVSRARHCRHLQRACPHRRRLRWQIWPPPTVYIAVIVPRADLKASHMCLLNGSVLLTVLRRPPIVPLRGIPLPPLDELRCQAHIAAYTAAPIRKGTF